MREFCTSLARTDLATPAVKKVSLFDDPVQQLLTVTMGDLKEADSGWYMCGVEVGGGWTPDVVAYTYIKVVHGEQWRDLERMGLLLKKRKAKCIYLITACRV